MAYDETYTLWQSIHSQHDNIKAELAFKDCYEQIVANLVAERIACTPYTPKAALTAPKEPKHIPADDTTAQKHLDEIKQLIRGKKVA